MIIRIIFFYLEHAWRKIYTIFIDNLNFFNFFFQDENGDKDAKKTHFFYSFQNISRQIVRNVINWCYFCCCSLLFLSLCLSLSFFHQLTHKLYSSFLNNINNNTSLHVSVIVYMCVQYMYVFFLLSMREVEQRFGNIFHSCRWLWSQKICIRNLCINFILIILSFFWNWIFDYFFCLIVWYCYFCVGIFVVCFD